MKKANGMYEVLIVIVSFVLLVLTVYFIIRAQDATPSPNQVSKALISMQKDLNLIEDTLTIALRTKTVELVTVASCDYADSTLVITSQSCATDLLKSTTTIYLAKSLPKKIPLAFTKLDYLIDPAYFAYAYSQDTLLFYSIVPFRLYGVAAKQTTVADDYIYAPGTNGVHELVLDRTFLYEKKLEGDAKTALGVASKYEEIESQLVTLMQQAYDEKFSKFQAEVLLESEIPEVLDARITEEGVFLYFSEAVSLTSNRVISAFEDS